MEKLKVLSLFSGIGAFEKALTDLKIPFELMNYCEIDKFASFAYSLIHKVPLDLNLGDISEVDEKDLPNFDLMTYGFPCQSISMAGLKEGLKMKCSKCSYEFKMNVSEENICPHCNSKKVKPSTRSGLLYEALRIAKYKKPKYLIAENVKNLVGKNFKEDFNDIIKALNDIGYNNYWAVLDSKDFGVPQSRQRVFIVSIRKDINIDFKFNKGFESTKRLKHILETDVDEKYYLSEDKCISIFEKYKDLKLEEINKSNIVKVIDIPKEILNDNERQRRVYSPEGIAPTVLARNDSAKIICIGMLDMKASQQVRRVYSPEGFCPTLDTMQGGHRQPKILLQKELKYRIRKITPLESFLLMGFKEEDYRILRENKYSDSQIYKMAGNSIVVDVLKYIFIELFKDRINNN